MTDDGEDLPPSQASSHFPIDPVDGRTLYRMEKAQRDRINSKGPCLTGCVDLDEQVLVGGFERGRVVGISAEDEHVGLVVGTWFLSLRLAQAVGRT